MPIVAIFLTSVVVSTADGRDMVMVMIMIITMMILLIHLNLNVHDNEDVLNAMQKVIKSK